MEIPTSVVASELWLRDDLEEVYALLFRFLGFGFRLAMSNVGWLVTQKFVILVPDPIAFVPRPALLDPGEPCDICQHTSFRPRVCSCVTLPSQVHRRQKQLSDFVSTKSKKSTAKRARFVTLAKSHKTVTCHGLRVMEPVCHQASLRGRFRSWMRASRQGQPCGRRRPEKWTRTRKAVSRRSVTVDFVCLYSSWFNIFDHKTTVAGGAAAAGGAGGALRPGASLVTVDVYTSARSLFLSLRADGARQVRLACAKPQTSREVDQDPEGGLTRQCNTRPSFLIMCCCLRNTNTSRRWRLLHRAAQAQHRQAL